MRPGHTNLNETTSGHDPRPLYLAIRLIWRLNHFHKKARDLPATGSFDVYGRFRKSLQTASVFI